MPLSPLIGLIVFLIVIGLVLYLIQSLLPIDDTIKRVIYVVVIIVVMLVILRFFGLM